MRKKLYKTGVAHPSVYSDALLPVFARVLEGYELILDPFAGVGRIHELQEMIPCGTVGIEIEKEWADCHEQTLWGDSLKLDRLWQQPVFDAICVSPTYGNRMADKHNARDGSLRRSYTHDLGHELHPNNSGGLQWGPEYRMFHTLAWSQAFKVLKHGGRFVLNCKNHIRGGKEMLVCEFHVGVLNVLGLKLVERIVVGTPGNRHGENRELRCPEYVFGFDKP